MGDDGPSPRALRSKTDKLLKSGGKRMMRRGAGRIYRIVVRSELGDTYAEAFEGRQMHRREGDTVLTGWIIDQPRLFGILERINGLGLELLSVQALPSDANPGPERKSGHEAPEL